MRPLSLKFNDLNSKHFEKKTKTENIHQGQVQCHRVDKSEIAENSMVIKICLPARLSHSNQLKIVDPNQASGKYFQSIFQNNVII
jgi:hypothetical protein